MVIKNTQVLALSASASKSVSYAVRESGARRFGGVNIITDSERGRQGAVFTKSKGKLAAPVSNAPAAPAPKPLRSLADIRRDFKLALLEAFFRSFGMRFLRLKPLDGSFLGFQNPFAAPAAGQPNIVYERVSELSIEQSMSFSAKGIVETADGRSIGIDIELSMSASFYERHSERFEAVINFCDPLVINFNAPSAALSQTTFAFDLDCSGSEKQISQLLDGSGFLAVDWNGDGVINNGGELFGARTGNGFAELAAHDHDKNGWLDAADPIFQCLRVWSRGEDGSQSLVALGELGIGAVFLGYVSADYALGDLANPSGMLRSTGIFLREDGSAGTVQHVDLRL
jgi:hypothetical protein